MSLVLPFIRIYSSDFSNVIFRIVGLVSLILLICLPQISQVYGHAFVISSNPSPSQNLKIPPTKIVVHLSEPVDLKYSKLSVIGPDGKNEIDNKDVQYVNGDQTALSVSLPRQGLKDGVYTVSTRMLSQVDGHVTDNAFVFGVGEGAAAATSQYISTKNIQPSSAQLSIPDVVARFPTLVGQVMIVGAAFTTLWLWRPFSKLTWLQTQTQTAFLQTRTKIDRSLVNLMLIGSIILVVSDFGMIFVQAYSINASIIDAIGTKFGTVWIVRAAESFMILGFVVIMHRRLKREDSRRPSQKNILFILALGLGTLLTTSLIGHGAAIASGNIVPITLDFIHNLAASFWIGGVIYLAFVVVPKIKQAENLEEYVKASALSIIIPRFSTIPVIVLGIIVNTGPFLLFILEDNLDLILASLYGKALIAKLVFAAVMLGIGAYNQTVIRKRALMVSATERSHSSSNLLVAIEGLDTEDPISKTDKRRRGKKSAVLMFNKSTKAEAAVGLMLLVAVAVMVNTGLPKSEFRSQLQQQQQQLGQASIPTILPLENAAINKGFTYTKFIENGSRVQLTINPYSLGDNNFKISFLDQNKNPIDMKSVELKLTQTEQGIGPIQVYTKQVSKGIFSASAAFGIPGEWEVLVEGFQNKEDALNLVSTYNLFVKPSLNRINYSVTQIKIPYNNSLPLYPIYDKNKNVIWVGDTSINSGRIIEYNLNNGTYSAHKINGTNIITQITLDSNNTLWYMDPITKVLGHYNPDTNTHQSYELPKNVVPSGIAFDSINNKTKNSTDNIIWITSSSTNEILRFDTSSNKFLTPLQLPTSNASPLGITVDPLSGQIWIAESSVDKIANIDPTTNKIIEYSPGVGKNNTLIDPTSIITDPFNGNIYISEHDGHTVSIFNPVLKTFNRFPTIDSNGLPFGMALDNDRNLWVAEHVIDKIAVLDTRTGEHKEVDIPISNPSFIQWLTSDSKGNIWFAEQRGNSIGFITSAVNLLQTSATLGTNNSDNRTQISGTDNGSSNRGNGITNDVIPQYGLNYVDIAAPMVAVGIVLSAIFYTKSVNDLKRSIRQVNKVDDCNDDDH
jgi:copper transport protein